MTDPNLENIVRTSQITALPTHVSDTSPPEDQVEEKNTPKSEATEGFGHPVGSSSPPTNVVSTTNPSPADAKSDTIEFGHKETLTEPDAEPKVSPTRAPEGLPSEVISRKTIVVGSKHKTLEILDIYKIISLNRNGKLQGLHKKLPKFSIVVAGYQKKRRDPANDILPITIMQIPSGRLPELLGQTWYIQGQSLHELRLYVGEVETGTTQPQ